MDFECDGCLNCDANQRGLFFVYLWVIWTERNNLLWNDGFFSAVNAVQWATKFVDDYQKVQLQGGTLKRQGGAKWRNPPSGRLKINFDGSYRAEVGDGGIGVIIRGSDGEFIAARTRYFPHVQSAYHMEAVACLEAFGFAE